MRKIVHKKISLVCLLFTGGFALLFLPNLVPAKPSLSKQTEQPYQACIDNNFPPAQITMRTTQIEQALLKKNAKLFVQQFSYPMVINENSRQHHKILTVQQLVDWFPKLYRNRSIKAILKPPAGNATAKVQWQMPICRADGVGLWNGTIWLHRDKNRMLKGFAINL